MLVGAVYFVQPSISTTTLMLLVACATSQQLTGSCDQAASLTTFVDSL